MKMQAAAKLNALVIWFIVISCQSPSFAQMSTTQFEIILKACADNKSISTTPDLLGKVSGVYADDATGNTLNDIGKFLSLIPETYRGAAYGLYQQCIVDILPRLKNTTPVAVGSENTPQLPTVTYKICSGEYERACQQHDVYLYCYQDVKAWAGAHCAASTVSRYNTYGGNKCGYAMDLVSCTGPK
jgi:hypothetical protein